MIGEQTDIFDIAGVAPGARTSDPVSSHLTLDSLGKDTSLNWRVFSALMVHCRRCEERVSSDGIAIAVGYDRPATDDDLLDVLEQRYPDRRWQRNIIARQRGLLVRAGWVKRVEDVTGITGRPTIAHVPTYEGIQV